jgi:hypothetical protein
VGIGPTASEELFASRLAARCQLPIIAVGAASGVIAACNLLTPLVPDSVTEWVAAVVSVPAAILFLSATFDRKFSNALSAFNARKRPPVRKLRWGVILFGQGLPRADRLLLIVSLFLLIEVLAAGNIAQRLSSAALSGAAFVLLCMTRIALLVRGFPADKLELGPPFA